MSLKAFHLFFITISVVMTAGLVAWSLGDYRATGSPGSLMLLVLAVPACVGLVAYGAWVRRKLSRLTVLLAMLVAAGEVASACPVCFGDPGSALVKGTANGVLFLVGVVGMVLGSIAWTAFTWARRARELERIAEQR